MERIKKCFTGSLLALLLLLSGQQLHAQVKSGVRFGLNYQNITQLDPQESNGFHVGTYLKFSLAGILTLEPGIQFSQRKYILDPDFPETKVKLNYIDVPVIVRIGIFPFVHIFGGPQASVLMGKKYKGERHSEFSQDLPKQELGAIAGIGFKLPLGINIQGSYDFGLSDLEYEGREIKNKIFKISVGKNF